MELMQLYFLSKLEQVNLLLLELLKRLRKYDSLIQLVSLLHHF